MNVLLVIVGVFAVAIFGILLDWLIKGWLPKQPTLSHVIAVIVVCIILVPLINLASRVQPPATIPTTTTSTLLTISTPTSKSIAPTVQGSEEVETNFVETQTAIIRQTETQEVIASLIPSQVTITPSPVRTTLPPVFQTPTRTAMPTLTDLPTQAPTVAPTRVSTHTPTLIVLPTSTNSPIQTPLPPTATSTQSSSPTYRVSVGTDGTQANNLSGDWGFRISANGHYVAFASSASNLVSGDTNNSNDIFIHDLQTGETILVSVASDGTQGNSYSHSPSLSGDGRYITFESRASNLVSGDSNETMDVFVYDRESHQTIRVSVASDGTQGNHDSGSPAISADGRYIVFVSLASNFVSGDTNEHRDIFVHDRETQQTTQVSVASNGTKGNDDSIYPSISADGRYVAFSSWAKNLVNGDTNDSDVFIHDQLTHQTTLISVDSSGVQAIGSTYNSAISADGLFVAFVSDAQNLVSEDTNGHGDVFIRDWQNGQTTRVSVDSDGTQGNNYSNYPSLSADGRYVAFESNASNLVGGDTNGRWDTFVYDRETHQTTRVSIASDGAQGNSDSYFDSYFPTYSLSADGRYVAFSSWASNLISDDTNGYMDVFVRDRYATATP